MSDSPLRVALVGPCAAGKSSLRTALVAAGYEVRHVAQEHSYVPDMWQRISKPDVLIYLDVDLENIERRRPSYRGGASWLKEQKRRLSHAREHADLVVDTRTISAADVAAQVLNFLSTFGQ